MMGYKKMLETEEGGGVYGIMMPRHGTAVVL